MKFDRVPCAGCDEGFHIAQCVNDEVTANLRAVRAAAPEMYRMLETCAEWLEGGPDEETCRVLREEHVLPLLDELRGE